MITENQIQILEKGHIDEIKALFDKGLDPNLLIERYLDGTNIAALLYEDGLLKYELVEFSQYSEITPTMLVASKNSIAAIKFCLQKGGQLVRENQVNARTTLYQTAFLYACMFQTDTQVLQFLIDKGSDVKRKLHFDNRTYSAIMLAARYNPSLEIIKFLIKNKAGRINEVMRFNTGTIDGSGGSASPLILAVRFNSNSEIVKELLNNKAKKTIRYKQNGSQAIKELRFNRYLKDDEELKSLLE